MNRWEKDQDDDEFLTDLLFETSLSITEIAKQLETTVPRVNQRINQLGLSWIKDSRKKMSKGQSILTSVVKKLLPGEKVVNEFHIGQKLKLDVYCPSYKIALEYHGRQHFYYTERFFESKYEFEEAQKRDQKKAEMCDKLGIVLIVFRYNDSLTEQSVYDRIVEAIRKSNRTSAKNIKKPSIKDSPFYKEAKKKNSDRRKKIYKEIKEKKKNDRKRSF